MGQRFDSYSFFDGTSMTPVTQVTWSDYWRGVIPDGVVAQVGNEMVPYGNSTGMYVNVDTGACIVDNHRGVVNSARQIPVAAADPDYPRIDLLIARVVYGNENQSYIELDTLTGEPDVDPVMPVLTQVTGVAYEIKLAEIYVPAGAVTIRAEDVTDTRDVFRTGIQSNTFTNTDEVPLERGMLVTLDKGNPYGIKRAVNSAVDFPIGVVMSEYISVGGSGRIDTTPGEIAKIKCGSAAVVTGDALVPIGDSTGLSVAGGGYAGGLALESKEEGIIANVKSLLHFGNFIPIQGRWWLLAGFTEEDVAAAYDFTNALTLEEALLNVNEGTVFQLTPAGSITWTHGVGILFAAADSSGLHNSDLQSDSDIVTAVFGYTGVDNTANNVAVGGVFFSPEKSLQLRGVTGYESNSSLKYWNKIIVTNSVTNTAYNAERKTSGVLTVSWPSADMHVYHEGIELPTASDGGVFNATNNLPIIGQRNYLESGMYNPLTYGSFTVTGCVFYKRELTPAQIIEATRRIHGLGGL